jgi:DNA-binding MarR family transcriptional regulator
MNMNVSPIDCCFSLRKVTRAVTQFYDRTLQLSGIRSTQFTLLLFLRDNIGQTFTEIAKRLGMDRTTLTRNLDPLRRGGLIVISLSDDKRKKECRLTPKGLKIIENALPLWEKAQKYIIGQLGNNKYLDLLNELESIRSMACEGSELVVRD